MCKLILMELFEVDTIMYGDRHDHIVSIDQGVVKQRVDVISSQIEGNPMVLVLNIQIPGDPPVSIVTYFAVPNDLREELTSENDQKFLRFKKK